MEVYVSVLFLSLIAASAMVSTATPKENDIRLVSMFPQFIRLGRVEVYHEGRWGSVCDAGFGVEAADVACRQWGFRSGAYSLFNLLSPYGSGTGPFWLSNVRCIGTEAKLTDCPADPWGQNHCSRDREASVICRGTRNGQVNAARGLYDMTEELKEDEVNEEKEEEFVQYLKDAREFEKKELVAEILAQLEDD